MNDRTEQLLAMSRKADDEAFMAIYLMCRDCGTPMQFHPVIERAMQRIRDDKAEGSSQL